MHKTSCENNFEPECLVNGSAKTSFMIMLDDIRCSANLIQVYFRNCYERYRQILVVEIGRRRRIRKLRSDLQTHVINCWPGEGNSKYKMRRLRLLRVLPGIGYTFRKWGLDRSRKSLEFEFKTSRFGRAAGLNGSSAVRAHNPSRLNESSSSSNRQQDWMRINSQVSTIGLPWYCGTISK